MLPDNYSLETHGPSYGTEEWLHTGEHKLRTLDKPVPRLALGEGGVWWRLDLDGYAVVDPATLQPRSSKRTGALAFRKSVKLAVQEKLDRSDIPAGARPYGEWRRVTGPEMPGQERLYDHLFYGGCRILYTDGHHAIIETLADGDRLEVIYANLTPRPFDQGSTVRNRQCRACAHSYPTYFDSCPSCGTRHKPEPKIRTSSRSPKTTKLSDESWDDIMSELLQ